MLFVLFSVGHSVRFLYETVSLAHILLSGLSILSAFWHWSYWDLSVFVIVRGFKLVLDLNQIFLAFAWDSVLVI